MSKLTADPIVVTIPKDQLGAIGTGPRQGSKERCAEQGLRNIDGVVDINTYSWGPATTLIVTVQLDSLDQKERIYAEVCSLLHGWYGAAPTRVAATVEREHHPA